MSSGPRLDVPGVLHHVMVRGIERPRIFRAASQARRILAYVWIERLGRRASDLARALNQTRVEGDVAKYSKL